MKPAILALTLIAASQAAPPQSFRSSVDVVQVDVSVTRGAEPVSGLTDRDFLVTDNGVEQDVSSVTLERLPLDVQLLLDTSGSVSGDRLKHLLSAADGLIAALRPGERVSLITFSQAVHVRVAATEDFASVRASLLGVTGGGQTALRDAAQLALALGGGDTSRRPLVLVFTDGVDHGSWLSEDDVLDSARRVGVVVHVVREESFEYSRSTFVEQLTKASGGRIWSASSERDLDRLFTQALDEMRARYLLTFSPRGAPQPGWHQLSVKLRSARGDVVARPGYFVSP
jgi:VWFA-related protein